MEKPLYVVIYEKLKEDIENGVYKVGEKIPSEKELSELWGVSRITPKRSLEKLVSEGLIVRQAGRGSFVAEVTRIQPARGKLTNYIGVIIPNLDTYYAMDLINSIEREAAKNDSFIILKRSLGNSKMEKEAIRELIKAEVTGIIILPAQAEHFNEEILKLVISDFPIVLIDRYLKGVPAVSISSYNYAASKKLTEYLFELGHDNVCLLTSPPADTSALEERYEGFIAAHVENNLNIDKSRLKNDISFSYTEENIQKDVTKIKNHLKENPHLTALLATEYRIALLAEYAVEMMNLRVPEDISIACFDNSRESVIKRQFTYIRQQQHKMGEMAVRCVLEMQKGGKLKKETIKLETDIIEGNSTAYLKTMI